MHTAQLQPARRAPRASHLGIGSQSILALVCLGAGAAPLAARWIPDDAARLACGSLISLAFLAFALAARRAASLRTFADLAFAFFVLALVQLLNNALPGYVGTDILHDPPNAGNPLASTVGGTVVVQLLDTAIAIVPIVILTLVSGRDLGSIYVHKGKLGRWFVFAVVFFIGFYLFAATVLLRPGRSAQRVLPISGVVTVDRFLALTPALLVIALSNGFEEELLFRGLFLQKYDAVFDVRVSNALQAAIFSWAHAGVTYTPSAALFIAAFVFPLGLAAGYLMRTTQSVLTPAIFHGALDIAIYLVFLSYVS